MNSIRNLSHIGYTSSSGALAPRSWPMLMGGPSRAGRQGAFNRIDPKDLGLAWQFDVHAQVSASPVAVGNQLFVGGENGNLYAIDLLTRKLEWLFHAAGGIASTPAVAGGMVYFLGREGVFQALHADSGAPAWAFRTEGETRFSAPGMYGQALSRGAVVDPWDFYLSSPLVHEGRVYIGSSDQRIYALEARTGRLIWTYRTGGMVHSSPALAGRNIVVGSWDGAVYALDADTGQLRWRFQTETEQRSSVMLGIQASPSVDGGVVYIGSRDGHFYAIRAGDGSLQWRYDAQGSWVASTAAVDDRRVYFGTSDTGLLIALDKHTGKEQYRFVAGAWTFASPVVVGDDLITASACGEVFVLDAASGQQRWRYQTRQAREDRFGLFNGHTGRLDHGRLFGTAPHTLHSALEHVKRLGAFLASPLWFKDQLIVVAATGEILVFGERRPR